MSQAPRPTAAAPLQTPPPASIARSAAPIGIAANPSTLGPAAEAESPSCLSQIWSTVSSIVSSIFSWISSLWNCVTGGTSQAAAPAALRKLPPRFYQLEPIASSMKSPLSIFDKTLRTRLPSSLMWMDKESLSSPEIFRPASTDTIIHLENFAAKGWKFLRGILRQNPLLTQRSTVELCVADIRRHSEPEGKNPNAPSDYRLLTTTLIAADNISSSNLGDGHANSIPVHTAAQICNGRMFPNCTLVDDHLLAAFMYFVANRENTRSGWTCEPSKKTSLRPQNQRF